MLFLEIPPFDLLTSQMEPYTGFGDVIVGSDSIECHFLGMESQARKRISEVFNLQLNNPSEVADVLEGTVEQMWADGWRPKDADVNLFTTDFGCVLTEALRRDIDGKIVFRSSTDLSHVSLWWPTMGVEAFPFHKVYKRLINEDGESIAFFARQLAELTQHETD